MTASESAADRQLDQDFERAQLAYLDRCAPGSRTRRVRWSGGSTQIIEIGAGTPLLLLHGGLGEAFQWGPLFVPLARQHRVLAVDRPGHGFADPFDYTGVDLLAHARQFIGNILDAEQLQSVPIVATSMGALWAVSYARENPNRVRRLILPGSPAGITRTLPLQLRLSTLPILKSVIRNAMSRPTRDSVRAFWKQILVVHAERLDDDFLNLSAMSQQRNCRSWFTLMDAAFTFSGMKPELLLDPRWPELTVRTTIVLGEKDAFGGLAEAKAAATRNPLIDVVQIADAGHAPWFDQPAEVIRAIEGRLVAANAAAASSTPSAAR